MKCPTTFLFPISSHHYGRTRSALTVMVRVGDEQLPQCWRRLALEWHAHVIWCSDFCEPVRRDGDRTKTGPLVRDVCGSVARGDGTYLGTRLHTTAT